MSMYKFVKLKRWRKNQSWNSMEEWYTQESESDMYGTWLKA